jgi:spermidine/putrescine transport system permease protein
MLKIQNRKNALKEARLRLQRSTRGKKTGIAATISPTYLWMTLFLAIPMIFIFIISLSKRSTYGQVIYSLNIDNYTIMFKNNFMYLKVFWDSIVLAFFTTLFCLILGYPFAYCIAKAPKRYRGFLMMLVIIPFWTNSLVRTYAWIILLRSEGIINTLLMRIGLISEPLALLYNRGAVFVGMVYTLFPFMVLPLYSSIDKLDKSILEAASDLGAVPWRRFWHVTLPLTLPGVTAGSILVFIPTLGYFFIPDLMGGGTTMLIGNLIKNQFLSARNWPFGASLSVLLILLTLIIIKTYEKLLGSKGNMEVI